jgi:hypothetical protein
VPATIAALVGFLGGGLGEAAVVAPALADAGVAAADIGATAGAGAAAGGAPLDILAGSAADVGAGVGTGVGATTEAGLTAAAPAATAGIAGAPGAAAGLDATTGALGFAGDVTSTGGLPSFLADPTALGGTAAAPDSSLALTSGLTGNVTPVGGLPSLGAANTAAGGVGAATTGTGVSAVTPDAWTAAGLDLPSTGAATGSTPLDLTAGTPAATSGTAGTPAATGFDLNVGNTTTPLSASDLTNGPPAGSGNDTGLLSDITNSLKGAFAPLQAAMPALGLGALGYNLYTGYQEKQTLNALQNTETQNAATAAQTASTENAAAQPLLNSGSTVMNYLTTNTLPPQFQSQLTQAVAAAKAAITQGYASRGMSTNPNENSALAQDLANVDLQAQTQQANLEQTLATAGQNMVTTANQLLSSGLNATEFSAQLPMMVQKLNVDINTQMSTAFSNFAAAINGSGNKGVTLTLPSNVINSSGALSLGA